MRVVLLEDSYLDVESIANDIRRSFSDATVIHISTESEFREHVPSFAQNPPDLFVLDVMVRWADLRQDMEVSPPVDVANEGYYRAGIRCQKLLAEHEVTSEIPVILYSILDRGEYEADIQSPKPNIIGITKSSDGRLSAVIRSIVDASDATGQHKPSVFVVHGHDDAAKESVARLIEKVGLQAVILHEQANAGMTIIEKIEAHSEVVYAVILLTPDDVGRLNKKGTKLQGRARQNVILELGYFTAKLGRQNVCVLHKPDVDVPSDFQGILYTPMDDAGAWRAKLAKEMKVAGLPIDTNKILDLS
jgi:hypothetical protein